MNERRIQITESVAAETGIDPASGIIAGSQQVVEASEGNYPSITWNGQGYRIAWERSSEVRFGRFDALGVRTAVDVTVGVIDLQSRPEALSKEALLSLSRSVTAVCAS